MHTRTALLRGLSCHTVRLFHIQFPHEIQSSRSDTLIDAIATGQLVGTGRLIDPPTGAGRALAKIDIVDDLSSYQIPLGSAAQVAIYTEHLKHLSLLRKILLRMRSWENFVFLEGH